MNSDIDRIRILHELDLLDTEPEKMFDDITEIASKVCNMPIALISLVDINRQFFKSNLGLSIRETPLEESFCKVAIDTPGEIFIVENAALDERFKNTPLVLNNPKIVSYYGVPLYSKSGISFGTLCVLDKVERKLTEEQKNILKKLSKQIEYLIELRTNNKLLLEYQTQTEMYSKNMEEFAYLAAHDLKAPVRGIDSFVKLLEQKYEHIWDSKDKKYISFIHQSSIKINHLIRDLLEYSKSNMDATNYENFDLKELIADVFNSQVCGNNYQKPVLICEELPTIFNSKIAFTIIFNNLINNALKYQEKQQSPIIEIKYIEDYTHWIFTVRDNGIGIEKEYFDQIFKPLKRLHSNSEYQGSGLGLAACAKIVGKLNGKINVESVVGEGTSFTIKIPKK